MSYNPPESSGSTEPTGGNETRNMGEASGQPTMPTGGYNPPPPPPPSGGYAPPPAGGYTPPPPGGGYGYGAPPPPPPPPQAPPSTPLNMSDLSKVDYQNLFQKYLNITTKPNVATHEAEIPHANWMTVLVSVGGTTIIRFVFGLLTALLISNQSGMLGLGDLQSRLNAQGSNINVSQFTNFASGVGIWGAVLGLILTPLFFFCGVWLQFGLGRMFGGTGSNIMTHSYLASLSYAPTRVVASVLSIIPAVGAIGGLLNLYQIYLTGLSLQASQRMTAGRAQLAVWLPILVGIVLFCLIFVLCIGIFASALSNVR